MRMPPAFLKVMRLSVVAAIIRKGKAASERFLLAVKSCLM
jgi:hypothetical protein